MAKPPRGNPTWVKGNALSKHYGQLGAQKRWNKMRRLHIRVLQQTGETALKSYTELVQGLARSKEPQAIELARAARRLLTAFANLWELDGHDLPPSLQDQVIDAIERGKEEDRARQQMLT